jgi:hypothetical protein
MFISSTYVSGEEFFLGFSYVFKIFGLSLTWQKISLSDYKTAFSSPLPYNGSGEDFLRFSFFRVFHFLFRKYLEFGNPVKKNFQRQTQGTFLQKLAS